MTDLQGADTTPRPDLAATVTGGIDRPAMPSPTRIDLRRAAVAGILLALLVGWLLLPAWRRLGDSIIGDADTDSIRGMWGIDHIRRSILPPDFLFWSDEVNFPQGVFALVLPLVSGLLSAPLAMVAGPVAGWNLSVAAMLWTAGLATAWLVRTSGGTWSAGAVAGSAVLTQPMLLHAVADGTAEHASVWTIPAFLSVAVVALRRRSPVWGLGAGAAATLMALDSPYNAVFAFVFALFVLPTLLVRRWTDSSRRDLLWTVGAAAVTAALGAGLLAAIYSNFALSEAVNADSLPLGWRNATDLGVWWQFDWGVRLERDASLAPTVIPWPIFLGGVALCLVGAPRSLPWLAGGMGMLALSFGVNSRLGPELAWWFGGAGNSLGDAAIRLNTWLYQLPGLSSIRFPQRWLVPASMALCVGGGLGLTRLFELLRRRRSLGVLVPMLAVLLAAGATEIDRRTARFDLGFPMQAVPDVAFTEWIARRPGPGALLLLPQIRPAPRSGRRGDIPVFANISDGLSSADLQYLQVLSGRPVVGYPSLKTLTPYPLDEALYSQYRHWDDLTHPVLSGTPIPRAAVDEHNRPTRRAVVERLTTAGLRFVAVDLGCYDESGLTALRNDFGEHLSGEQRFDDGDGVVVFELK